MRLIVKISDNIDRCDGKPADYSVHCFIGEAEDGYINLTDKHRPYQVKTVQRLGELAKRIQKTVEDFYSGRCENPHTFRIID